MPGRKITKQQVNLYMTSRINGYTQVTSSAKAGISERSGKRIESNNCLILSPTARNWRTRKDPLAEIWDCELRLLLEESPALTPITLLEYLQEKYPGEYPDSLLRTLQRRIKEWKVLSGKEKELIFRQIHLPGRLGLSDFTQLKGIIILIQNEPLCHLLYHFRLAYSGWSYLKVILGGESYTALTEGLQEALLCLGGSPLEHRSDSLSAAFKNTTRDTRQDLTSSYEQFCQHYKMEATRNNLGKSHENGSIESSHGHLKRRIKQALLIRQSNNFESIEDYQDWLNIVVRKHNQRNAKNIILDKAALQLLPPFKTMDFKELVVPVHSTGTIEVARTTYSVPSCFQGAKLRVHLYDNRLCCYLGSKFVIELPRIRAGKEKTRARLINYRHLIDSLVKKPQAFRFSILRDDIIPNQAYKDIWSFLEQKVKGRESCKIMVGILSIAAKFDCEKKLSDLVTKQVAKNQIPNLDKLRQYFSGRVINVPTIDVEQHELKGYDDLLLIQEVKDA